MNKGNWTSNGHFIVVWWADRKICINDPSSTKNRRVNGELYTFRSKGTNDILRTHAGTRGESVNGFINRAIAESGTTHKNNNEYPRPDTNRAGISF